MLIDWFTVGAQALNFLILVALLKHFLYRPILHAIDEREKKIADELKAADAKKTEAQREHEEFQKKNAEWDQQLAALLKLATDEAKAERQRLMDEALKDTAELSLRGQKRIKDDEQELQKTIVLRTQREVFSIARRALTDLAGADLEERMVGIFVRRLSELTGDQKKLWGLAPADSAHPMILRTSSALSADLRAVLEKSIRAVFGAETPIKFEIGPELSTGIELTTQGRQIGWTIAEYLGALEEGVAAHGA